MNKKNATNRTGFRYFTRSITRDQILGTGMAMALIALLLSLFLEETWPTKLSVGILLLNMTVPRLFYPLAIVWIGASHVIGNIMSRFLLALLFLGLVTPLGLIRRMLGKDSLQLKNWKQGIESVFKTRNHVFTQKDLERPY